MKYYIFNKRIIIGCFFVLVFFLFLPFSFAQVDKVPVTVRVGIFQNKPIVFQDDSGKPQGLYIDLLNEIAIHQNWQLEFVFDSFANCLEQLMENKIDLLASIAYTKQRDLQLEFSKEVVCTLWGTVYVDPKSKVNTIFDLDNKQVAIMKKGVFGTKFKQLCSDFNVDCFFTETQSQHDSLNLLKSNKVEAAVFNNAFKEPYDESKLIKKTSIVFSPMKIYFASKKGSNHEKLEAIDSALREMKRDSNSLYYESLNKWLGVIEVPKKYTPQWLKYALIASCIVLVCSLVWVGLLFSQIRRRKKAEEKMRQHVQFLESLEKIDIAVKSSNDPDQMLKSVIETTFKMFNCDRAWLLYPCDPNAPSFNVPIESAHPEYPGAEKLNLTIPMTPSMQGDMIDALAVDRPVACGPGNEKPLSADTQNEFSVQSQMFVSIHPKIGSAWMFGMHQCSYARVWTKYERMLFNEIGRRVADGLSGLLYFRNLIQSEEKYRLFMEASPDPIVVYDMEGKVIFLNPAFTAVFGWTLEELRGGKIDFVPEEEWPITRKMLDKMIGGERYQGFETRRSTKNGDIVDVNLSFDVWYDRHGNRTGSIVVLHDITERKQAEEEKRKALEFAAEQSRHALIGQVAGKMAHDFNNVLMGIMGNAQLAIMNCSEEKTRAKLERINEFSERGRDITNNLMSFSKDQEPKQTYFRIEDKIDLVLKMLEKDLSGVEIRRNYKPGIPELLADPGMIQDVLVNLIQNSIHAMSIVENPTLCLKAYSQNEKVYFEIEDNGCGIPKEHKNSIFTPSFTLKGSHDKTGSYKSGIKGTGYGMSNVKKYIVEKHKGDISVESEVGKGTKITISLRVIKDHLSLVEKKEVVESQIYDKRRVLLVEDESAIADVQYQILTKEPFNHIVSVAVNGQMAIDIFDRNKFDAVSLDYMLPGDINGLDVYNHIRDRNGGIPILFISGNIEFIESMKELRSKDPNLEHLSKPVDNLEYVNKVNELIGRTIK